MFCSNGESSKWSVASGASADTARSEDIGSTGAGAELPFGTDDSCFKTGRGDGLGGGGHLRAICECGAGVLGTVDRN